MARILVVDDEESIVQVLMDHLSQMGHEVVGEADSGRKSFELAKSLNPDLILMDIMMPGELDGIAAAQMIKEELGIPVVFLTAFADDYVIERAKRVDPLGYLVKPFNASQIKGAVEVALHKKGLERERKEEGQRDAWEAVASFAHKKLEALDAAEEAPSKGKPPARSTWVLIVALMVLVLLMMTMAVVQVIFKN